MATAAAPTFADQRWGSAPYALFDYWQNPVRESVDSQHPQGKNPVMLIRHGGGGVQGDYRDYRISDHDAGTFSIAHWMAGAQPLTNPAAHWDVCSFGSGQRTHLPRAVGLPAIARSRAILFPDAIRDCQFAISSIKHLLHLYGGDPRRMVGWGFSFGATILALSQLAPPRGGPGTRTVWTERHLAPNTHDSTLRGVVFNQGQIDCRKINGTNYLNPALVTGWFGTRSDSAVEVDALPDGVKAAASIRAYFEADETYSYPGIFSSYSAQGAHTLPLLSHDSQQHQDLIDAMIAANVSFGQALYGQNALVNTQWPNGPGAAELALYQAHESWMAARIA